MDESAGSAGAMVPGLLLLATPELLDPNFSGAVVLLLDVNADGALGVILNRPTPVLVSEVLGDWAEVVAEPEVLFQGGPVETDGALAVALLAPKTATSLDGVGFRQVVGGLGLLDLDTPVPQVVEAIEGLRIFAGYAGWGGGQLEGEIAAGHWYVAPAEAGDVFLGDASGLWRDVLRRQPGELAEHSTRPMDPELN